MNLNRQTGRNINLAAMLLVCLVGLCWIAVPAGAAEQTITSSLVRRLVTLEQEQEIMDFLQDKLEYQHEAMLKIKKSDPQQYQAKLRTWKWWMKRLEGRPEDVQVAYIIQQESLIRIRTLVKKIALADRKPLKDLFRNELDEVLDNLFQAEQVIFKDRLHQFEQQLAELKKKLKDRAENKQAILKQQAEKYNRMAKEESQETNSKDGNISHRDKSNTEE
ncbi:MAG: hypothetical protein ACLFVU_01620 [Phycisphaerae bacterium]